MLRILSSHSSAAKLQRESRGKSLVIETRGPTSSSIDQQPAPETRRFPASSINQQHEPEYETLLRATKDLINTIQQLYHPR
jgi:hypothetical protein